MKIGYARVSTEAQCLDRQVDALVNYGVDELYKEKITGTRMNRPEFEKVCMVLRRGDTLVIESLSRLGRSTGDLLKIISDMDQKGVRVISLKETMDTTTPTGKMLIIILSAISQFERDLISERTSEGLKSARARGKIGGRPRVESKKVDKALKLYRSGHHSVKEICELIGIGRSTLYREISNRDLIRHSI